MFEDLDVIVDTFYEAVDEIILKLKDTEKEKI